MAEAVEFKSLACCEERFKDARRSRAEARDSGWVGETVEYLPGIMRAWDHLHSIMITRTGEDYEYGLSMVITVDLNAFQYYCAWGVWSLISAGDHFSPTKGIRLMVHPGVRYCQPPTGVNSIIQ